MFFPNVLLIKRLTGVFTNNLPRTTQLLNSGTSLFRSNGFIDDHTRNTRPTWRAVNISIANIQRWPTPVIKRAKAVKAEIKRSIFSRESRNVRLTDTQDPTSHAISYWSSEEWLAGRPPPPTDIMFIHERHWAVTLKPVILHRHACTQDFFPGVGAKFIGVARIFSGGALFSSKKLTTFFSRG